MSESLAAPGQFPVELVAASFTHVGRVRSLNEDSVLDTAPFFLVADGMGGHEHGEVASGMVVAMVPSLLAGRPVSAASVRVAIEECNRRVHLEGGGGRGMGTTITGVVVASDTHRPSLILVNVGDSRTYRVRDGVLEQLSIDHSRVQELFQVGAISAEQMSTHPERNVITRAVGIEPLVSPDVATVHPVPGDRFLVCSDGLSGELSAAEIAQCLAHPLPSLAAQALLDAVLATPARDNISAIVVDVVSVQPPSVADDLDRTDPRGRPLPAPADEDTKPRSAPELPPPTMLIDDVPPATPSAPVDAGVGADGMIGEIPGLEQRSGEW